MVRRRTATSLLLTGGLALALAPSFAMGQDQESSKKDPSLAKNSPWTQPFVIDSRGIGKGGFASVGENYSSVSGRSMWLEEFLAGYGFNDDIQLWYQYQRYAIQGHHSGNHFDVQTDNYGAKWVFLPANDQRKYSLALEFAILAPGAASAVGTHAFETFNSTKNYIGAIDYGFGRGWQTQVAYASVRAAGQGYGNVYAIGVGKDLSIGSLTLRLQGQLVDDNTTSVDQVHNSDAIRPVLYGAFAYNALKWLRVEADATLFTSGMPLGDNDFGALSGYQVYSPGGAAANLRTETIGIASLRVVFHGKF